MNGIHTGQDSVLEWLKKEGDTKSYRQMEQQLFGENLKLLQDMIDKGEEVLFQYFTLELES